MKKIIVLCCLFIGLLIGFGAISQTHTSQDSLPQTVQQVAETKLPTSTGLTSALEMNLGISSILRGMLGLIVILLIAYLLSSNRKAINWKVVGIGLMIQIVFAVGVMQVPLIQDFFNIIGKVFLKIIGFTTAGTNFLYGEMLNKIPNRTGVVLLFEILPTIIFFSALTSLLFYLGVIQKVVYGLAWVLTKALKLSGAESLATSSNIFLGQTEAPLLIKPYIKTMTKSEILLVMIAGMATLAGGVLAAYIGFLGGTDPVQKLIFAKHLLTASVMAAPGAVVIAKILVPQTENIDAKISVTKEKFGDNVLDAIAMGTTDGLKLTANVAAMLLVFFAFIAFVNYLFQMVGSVTNLNHIIETTTNGTYKALSMEFILGYTFAPLIWLLGVCKQDMALVGQLLGTKIIATEFVAYLNLSEMKNIPGNFAETKSIIMATYILCGFANFASIGIQIGGIGSLAENQRPLISKLGVKAMIGGVLASLLSATIIGALIGG